jgi:hypothetical protein
VAIQHRDVGAVNWRFTDVTFSGTSVVPEPSTWAMMALGFAGLAFAGCRARRTPAVAI